MVEQSTFNRLAVGSIPTSGAYRYPRPPAVAPRRAARERPGIYALATRATRNPKAIGELSEMTVALQLMRSGYDVAQPFGDNARYDLVIDDGVKLLRVQVKTGRLSRDGGIVFPTCSSQVHRGRGRMTYQGQCDLFAVYCPELDATYLVPVADTGARSCTLRVKPPRNNQATGVRWAADYALRPNAG